MMILSLLAPRLSGVPQIEDTVRTNLGNKSLDLAIFDPSSNTTDEVTICRRNIIILTTYKDQMNAYENQKFNLVIAIRVIATFVYAVSLNICYENMHINFPKVLIYSFLAEAAFCLFCFNTYFLNAIAAKYQHHLFQQYQNEFFSFRYTGKLEDPCTICLEDIKPNQPLIGHISDGKVPHLFHQNCIERFSKITEILKRHLLNCPICKKTIVQAKITVA